MILFDNVYTHLYLDESCKAICHIWLSDTKSMLDADYRAEINGFFEFLEKYPQPNLLVNCLELNFTISPATQNWFLSLAVPKYVQCGVKKIAMILSNDFFAQVSTEQMVEDAKPTMPFELQYFNNQEDALKWFKK